MTKPKTRSRTHSIQAQAAEALPKVHTAMSREETMRAWSEYLLGRILDTPSDRGVLSKYLAMVSGVLVLDEMELARFVMEHPSKHQKEREDILLQRLGTYYPKAQFWTNSLQRRENARTKLHLLARDVLVYLAGIEGHTRGFIPADPEITRTGSYERLALIQAWAEILARVVHPYEDRTIRVGEIRETISTLMVHPLTMHQSIVEDWKTFQLMLIGLETI